MPTFDDANIRDSSEVVEQHAVIKCTTTAGAITMHFHREWSPHGYDRATTLFERGYYDQSHLFRVVPHFLVQFGISYTSDAELKRLADSQIQDDPKREDLMPFREGYMSFAGSGPNSRTSQLFIAYDRAGGLGNSPWETPFGEVVDGMDNVRNLYSGYGDMPPWGKGPQQGPIRNRGSSYIEEDFPMLDKFQECTVQRMDSLPGEKSMVENRDAMMGDVGYQDEPEGVKDDQRAMRGSKAKTKDSNHQVPLPRKLKKKDDAFAIGKFPLFGKLAILAMVLAIIAKILARRKKNKQVEKSV
ncbi:hypothetical protein ACHAXR_009633 [Thalassiosira sp. AJA248-18]